MANLFTPEIRTDKDAQKRVRDLIDELRSGKYHQTSGVLRQERFDGAHAFCCLGVACNLLDANRWSPVPNADTPRDAWGGDTSEFAGYYLPRRAQLAFHFRTEKGTYDGSSYDDLVHANDQGADFSLIADVIERELNAALA